MDRLSTEWNRSCQKKKLTSDVTEAQRSKYSHSGLIAKKTIQKRHQSLNRCFIDFYKDFNSIYHDTIWTTLKSFGIEDTLVRMLKQLDSSAETAVSDGGNRGEGFGMEKKGRQGGDAHSSLSCMLCTFF